MYRDRLSGRLVTLPSERGLELWSLDVLLTLWITAFSRQAPWEEGLGVEEG